MRKVNICNVSKQIGGYRIYIDADHQFTFNNKKDVEKAFTALNSYFTKALFFLNQIYCDVFTVYRLQYFVLDNVFINNNCKKEFESIEQAMDLALNRSSWPNGNTFTLKHIENIYSSLFSVLLHLKEHAKKRSDTATIYLIDSKQELITLYYKNFIQLKINLNEAHKQEIQQIIEKLTA